MQIVFAFPVKNEIFDSIDRMTSQVNLSITRLAILQKDIADILNFISWTKDLSKVAPL